MLLLRRRRTTGSINRFLWSIMPESKSRKNRRSEVSRPRLPKMFLLPMPDECVRDFSLKGHLALEGSQRIEGNRDSVLELTRILYLTFFMQEVNVGCTNLSALVNAEQVLDQTAQIAERTGIWRLDREDVPTIEKILRMYDEELAGSSTRKFFEAEKRMNQLLRTHHLCSPLRQRICAVNRTL